ncbi:MAG: hydrocarbon-binding protein [Myxococcota bacterium]
MSKGDLRQELGDFNSIICFKAVVTGVEDTLGASAAAVALKAAGRRRGRVLAETLGFGKSPLGLGDAARVLDAAIGVNGTRLCRVDRIVQEGDAVRVALSETVCSAGEPQGSSRELSFTLGAVQGAVEVLLAKKLRARQVESVLRGGTHDVIELTPV